MNSEPKSPFPAHIRSIAVTAPAGQPDGEKLQNELDFISRFVNVKCYLAVPESKTPSYLAGEKSDRLALLNAAIKDPEDFRLSLKSSSVCYIIS